MTYHFVKHVGIDVEARNLCEAVKFLRDAERYDGFVELRATDLYEKVADNHCVGDYDIHSGNAEYVGYTEDTTPEKRLYDYLTEDENEEDTPDVDFAGLLRIAIFG